MRAQSEYDRQVSLIESNATSRANVEKWLSERDQAAAQVELAKLNLGYTRVSAPFSGRIGRRLVDPGNLVGPSVNTKLATLDQLEPIYVYFNLNERDALQAAAIMRQRGLDPRGHVGKAPVLVGLQNQEGYPAGRNARLRGHRRQHFLGHDRSCGRSSTTRTMCSFPGPSRGCAFRWANPSRCWWCPQRHRQRPGRRLRAGGRCG